jgi:hypothetical protein
MSYPKRFNIASESSKNDLGIIKTKFERWNWFLDSLSATKTIGERESPKIMKFSTVDEISLGELTHPLL